MSLETFDEAPDKLKFLSDQYFSLTLLIKALEGDVVFIGAPSTIFKKEQT